MGGTKSQRASKEFLCRAEAAQCLQGGGRVRGRWLAAGSSRDAGISVFRDSELDGAARCACDLDRLSHRASDRVAIRDVETEQFARSFNRLLFAMTSTS